MNPTVGSPPTTVLPHSARYYRGAVLPQLGRYYRPTVLPGSVPCPLPLLAEGFAVVGVVVATVVPLERYYRSTGRYYRSGGTTSTPGGTTSQAKIARPKK